jgi:hypothetical protein
MSDHLLLASSSATELTWVPLVHVFDRLLGELVNVLNADRLAVLATHQSHTGREVASSTAHIQCSRAIVQVVLEGFERVCVHVRRPIIHSMYFCLTFLQTQTHEMVAP